MTEVPLTAESCTPRILVIGCQSVGKRSLINKIERTEDSFHATAVRWTIDTKYYTAAVTFHLATISQSGRLAGAPSNLASPDWQALVMVFDQSEVSTFQAIQSWSSTVDLSSFSILLCIGNMTDKVADHSNSLVTAGDAPTGHQLERDTFLRTVREWCLDSGIEFVETSAADPFFDSYLFESEEGGVTRVKSALEAHMWPGLKMKTNVATGFTVEDINSASSSSEEETSDDNDEEISVEYEPLGDEAPNEIWIPDGDDFLEPVSGLELSPMLTPIPVESDSASSGESGNGSKEGPMNGEVKELDVGQVGGTNSEDDGGVNVDELEQLMREMSAMRSNLRDMPDVARRDTAARLALRMAQLFGDD